MLDFVAFEAFLASVVLMSPFFWGHGNIRSLLRAKGKTAEKQVLDALKRSGV